MVLKRTLGADPRSLRQRSGEFGGGGGHVIQRPLGIHCAGNKAQPVKSPLDVDLRPENGKNRDYVPEPLRFVEDLQSINYKLSNNPARDNAGVLFAALWHDVLWPRLVVKVADSIGVQPQLCRIGFDKVELHNVKRAFAHARPLVKLGHVAADAKRVRNPAFGNLDARRLQYAALAKRSLVLLF